MRDFLLASIITLIISLVYICGYDVGENTAIPVATKMGWNAALDSVNLIMRQQIKNDTNHCTYLCIDTTKYYLEHKKICN
jgi:hypothetical protein